MPPLGPHREGQEGRHRRASAGPTELSNLRVDAAPEGGQHDGAMVAEWLRLPDHTRWGLVPPDHRSATLIHMHMLNPNELRAAVP